MAPRLAFRYRDDDPWPVVKQAFNIIVPYLQADCDTSASLVAERLAALTPARRELAVGERKETSASFLLEFWEVFIGIARQVPYDDSSSQERVARLLQELETLDTPSAEVSTKLYCSCARRVASATPTSQLTLARLDYCAYVEGTATFGPRLTRAMARQVVAFNGQDASPSPNLYLTEPSALESDSRVLAEWINLNSFVARIWSVDLLNATDFAVWTLRYCFETPCTGPAAFQECRLVAAAQYIEHCSPQLYKLMKHGQPSASEQGVLRSPLFRAEQVLCLERWSHWKFGFGAFAEGAFSDISKAQATDAVRIMERVQEEASTTRQGESTSMPREASHSRGWLDVLWSMFSPLRPLVAR